MMNGHYAPHNTSRMAVGEFRETLERLGLAQYHDGLVGEAFDSWEVLADITEEDMCVSSSSYDKRPEIDKHEGTHWV